MGTGGFTRIITEDKVAKARTDKERNKKRYEATQ